MNRESEYLLQLLRAYICQETPCSRSDADWEQLTALAHAHNITGILGYMAMTYPICPDPEQRAFLRGVCLNTISVYANRGMLAEQFSCALAEKGIDHILMKGYILRDLFPVPDLRTYGDIDIVIRQKDREQVHAYMLAWNFGIKTDWEPVYSYEKQMELYEIHTQIMEVDVSERADYRGYFLNPWEHVCQLGPHRYTFVPEYHFLYMLTHIAKHVTGSGAGIRMYLDIAVFVRHYGQTMDWAWVEAELEKLALTDFADTVLTLVRDFLGTPSPIIREPVKEDVLTAFAEYTMRGGIFGREAADSGINTLKSESRISGELSRCGTLVKRLFPSAASIRNRYTYLQDRPWLLPVAWVHRLAKTRGSLNEHAREARSILSADEEAVQKLIRLYTDIGL